MTDKERVKLPGVYSQEDTEHKHSAGECKQPPQPL